LTKTTLTEQYVLVEAEDIDFSMLRAAINQIAKTRYRFDQKVFSEPYAPYYDDYRDQTFVIDHASSEDALSNHVWLTCISDSSIKVSKYVHLDQLVIE
jgi:hypothetical protein